MPLSTLLAGDVGGTKTLLEVGTLHQGRWQPVFTARYAAADYADLPAVLRTFLQQWAVQSPSHGTLTAACFGVAGPAFDNRAQMTNLPWIVDGPALAAEFGIARVQVVNDFAAAAHGVELLDSTDVVVLQAGEALPSAPRIVIGAGTGLGVAYLIATGSGYTVIAGESGHAAFAPASLEQLELWRDLYTRHGRVSAEDVVSGAGLARIYEFIERKAGGQAASASEMRARPTPAAITQAALAQGDLLSLRALDLFIACYGEVAGNCALAVLARGGVYVAGGIAPRIISRLREGGFLAAFTAKGAHTDTMRKMPLRVVSHDRLGLLGCALIAGRLRL
jgi:glucokinase